MSSFIRIQVNQVKIIAIHSKQTNKQTNNQSINQTINQALINLENYVNTRKSLVPFFSPDPPWQAQKSPRFPLIGETETPDFYVAPSPSW